MNFYRQYIKYKKRYINTKYKNYLPYDQIGGYDDDSTRFIVQEGKIFKGIRIPSKQGTKIESIKPQHLELKRLSLNKYEYLSNYEVEYYWARYNEKPLYKLVFKRENSEVILVFDELNNILTSILYENEILKHKTFTIYFKETNKPYIRITMKEFDPTDKTYSTGSGEFEMYTQNDDPLKIVGLVSISAGENNVRSLELTIQKIVLNDFIIELPKPMRQISNFKNLIKIFPGLNIGNFFGKCKEIITELTPTQLVDDNLREDNLANYPDIISTIHNTICGKLFYYIPKERLEILMKYQFLLKIILASDARILKTFVNDKLKDRSNLDEYLKNINKIIPSKLRSKYISFKNGTNNWVRLDDIEKVEPQNRFTIIFDSGNFSSTLVGRNIVNKLNLPVSTGCRFISIGVVGEEKKCGDYVELEFKFNKDYPHGSNRSDSHSYKIIAFVDDGSMINTILFGHISGLKELFDDNYSIRNMLEEGDVRIEYLKEEQKDILNAHNILNGIIPKMGASLRLEKNTKLKILNEYIQILLIDVKPSFIHSPNTPRELMRETFSNLNNLYNALKDDNDIGINHDVTLMIKKYIDNDF